MLCIMLCTLGSKLAQTSNASGRQTTSTSKCTRNQSQRNARLLLACALFVFLRPNRDITLSFAHTHTFDSCLLSQAVHGRHSVGFDSRARSHQRTIAVGGGHTSRLQSHSALLAPATSTASARARALSHITHTRSSSSSSRTRLWPRPVALRRQ